MTTIDHHQRFAYSNRLRIAAALGRSDVFDAIVNELVELVTAKPDGSGEAADSQSIASPSDGAVRGDGVSRAQPEA